MRQYMVMLIFTFLAGCQSNETNQKEIPSDNIPEKDEESQSFYVGTYTDGKSEGIYKYALSEKGQLKQLGLVAKSENPSFLTKSVDQQFLIAVNEINREDGTGTVESYRITKDGLSLINTSSSGGAHPCFVTLNNVGFVLTANYTGGNVGLLQLNQKGELSDLLDVQQHTGKGTTERQEGPHAHSAWFENDNQHIISVDLGTNELWLSKLDPEQRKLIPSDPQKLAMATGAGPRHLTFHPNNKWIYVVNELDMTITLVTKNESGSYENQTSISTLPKDYTDANTCADIHVSSDGKFVYASNRGHNSIVIYSVNPKDGSLGLIGHESTRGDGPRNFAISPDGNFLLVANQLTSNIISFKRDKATGLLTFISEIEAPTPVCILF